MNTPNRRHSGASLQDLAPSGSFLRQLLEDISRQGGPNVRDHATTQSSPHPQHASAKRRHSSSVWVGGTSIARDARMKLRAADEARFGINGNDGTSSTTPRPQLQLRIPRFGDASPSANSLASTPGDLSASPTTRPDINAREPDYMTRRDSVSTRPRHRPSAGLLTLPTTTTHIPPVSLGYSQATGLPSPLLLLDEGSDSSSAVSPSEAPTSAVSNTLTDATTVSDDPHGSHSPRRGTESLPQDPELAFRQTRTMTMPNIQGPAMSRLESSHLTARRSIGGDNSYIIRSSTFTERAGPPPEGMESSLPGVMPELSSFRPQAADAQGRPRAVPTPANAQAQREDSAELAETPIYARSFHLVDTDVSIYQKTHGDEWRERPLCLYCFRKHGNFRQLDEYGCEACGQDEALESHY